MQGFERSRRGIKSLHLLGAAAIALSTAATTAAAQDDGADVITVTGSRLTNANVESSSPVLTLDAEAIDVRGTTDIVDLLNTLPAAFAAQDTSFANGANGTSTLNLRGLGAQRTLVLANGKRLPPGSPIGTATGAGYASDLNLIPTQLVERVEIVTGGASAVYGSDAVAGVANFILRDDFEGFEFDGLFGFNQSNNNSDEAQAALEAVGEDTRDGSVTDNSTFDISAIFGANTSDGKGNVTAYFRYLKNDGIQQGDRDFSRCAQLESAPDPVCLGSNQGPFPTSFVVGAAPVLDSAGMAVTTPVFDINGDPILLDDGSQRTNAEFVGLIDAAGNPIGDATQALIDPDGSETDPANFLYDSAGNPIMNPVATAQRSLNLDRSLSDGLVNPFNFNPQNPIRRDVERFNAGFSGHYDITDTVEAYIDFGYTKSNSPQIIAPSAAFGSSINQVNCDNPLLTAEQLALICGTLDTGTGLYSRDTDGDGFAQTEVRRRFVEGGGRTDDRTLTNFRVVGGLRGTLMDTFEWDLFGQYAETELSRLQTNQVTFENLERALDIVDDGAGNLVCRSVVDGTDPNCVPFLTAFDPSATNDEGLSEYVDTPTLTTGSTAQTVVGGTIQGDLTEFGVQTPWASAGVNALVGFEYRKDQLFSQADGTASSGGLVGAGGATIPRDAETELWEVFLEASVPLISDMPYIEELGLTGAYRRSEYESLNVATGEEGGDFGFNTYSVGVSYTPVSDLRIRGQYQRATRAPNIFELFDAQNTNLSSLSDPCAGSFGTDEAPTASLAECQNTGVTAAQYGNIPPDSGQLNIIQGGNPDLEPEVSDTYTVGAVYQPSQVPGLTLSIDYFSIELEDAINTIPASFTLASCLELAQNCELINRGTDGSLTQVPREQAAITATNVNTAGLTTEGLDFAATYSYDLPQYGSLDFNYASTYLLTWEETPVDGDITYDCVGFYDDNCDDPVFEYRHNLSTTWNTPWDLSATFLWRYFSAIDRVESVDTTTGSITSFEDAGDGNLTSATLEAQHYLDFAMFYDVTDNVELRFGVNNLTDNDPPVLPTFGPSPTVNVEANTIAGTYVASGRFFFFGTNIRF
ncbi:MAG: TonB-dependent receptor [Pseudomonadota bacterium]